MFIKLSYRAVIKSQCEPEIKNSIFSICKSENYAKTHSLWSVLKLNSLLYGHIRILFNPQILSIVYI